MADPRRSLAANASKVRRGLDRLVASFRGTGAPFFALAVLLAALVCGVTAASGADDSADPCPNAKVRTGPSSLLPGCRAYEQVSPVDKNGGDITSSGAGATSGVVGQAAAENGGRIIFRALTEFAGAEYGGPAGDTEYLATRGAGGWQTRALSPPVDPSAAGSSSRLSTPDLALTMLTSSGLLRSDPPASSDEDVNAYGRNNVTQAVTPWFGVSSSNTALLFSGPVISRQGDHVAVGTVDALTADPVPDDNNLKVYERTNAGVRLVSVDGTGTPFPFAGVGSLGEPFSEQLSARGAMSDDGRHIFINTAADQFSPRELYRRSDGTTTTLVSPSKRTVPDPEGVRTKLFRLATPDGSRVFFTSAQHLTDDANTGPSRAGADLYRYDVEVDELVNISATAGGDGAQVQGVIGADAGGGRVYYAALGQVVPGEGSSSGTEPNIYLWEDDGTPDGSTSFVTTLASSDGFAWLYLHEVWTARVTSDAGNLLLQTSTPIPGHSNGGVQQIYVYNAGTDTIECISCNPNGDAPLGPASIPGYAGNVQYWEFPRAISDDGRRVFFNTADALVARDSNGQVDPYMWEDGELTLLSTGTSPRDSYFYNASVDGDDVFILTADALVPQDNDDLVDLYDARVGGGIPVPVPPDCEPHSCQGEGAAPPPAGPSGSSVLNSKGNVDSRDRLVLALERPSTAQLRKLARGGGVGIRVRVNRAARVRVLARQGGKVVASGRSRAARAGRVTVRLRLSRTARRKLRAGKRLSLTATAAGSRPRSVTVRLRGNR